MPTMGQSLLGPRWLCSFMQMISRLDRWEERRRRQILGRMALLNCMQVAFML